MRHIPHRIAPAYTPSRPRSVAPSMQRTWSQVRCGRAALLRSSAVPSATRMPPVALAKPCLQRSLYLSSTFLRYTPSRLPCPSHPVRSRLRVLSVPLASASLSTAATPPSSKYPPLSTGQHSSSASSASPTTTTASPPDPAVTPTLAALSAEMASIPDPPPPSSLAARFARPFNVAMADYPVHLIVSLASLELLSFQLTHQALLSSDVHFSSAFALAYLISVPIRRSSLPKAALGVPLGVAFATRVPVVQGDPHHGAAAEVGHARTARPLVGHPPTARAHPLVCALAMQSATSQSLERVRGHGRWEGHSLHAAEHRRHARRIQRGARDGCGRCHSGPD